MLRHILTLSKTMWFDACLSVFGTLLRVQNFVDDFGDLAGGVVRFYDVAVYAQDTQAHGRFVLAGVGKDNNADGRAPLGLAQLF